MRTFPLMFRVVAAAVLLTGAVGCAQKIEPEIASAANEPRYASEYPDQLRHSMDAINAGETKTKELDGKFGSLADGLKSPPWAKVLEVVKLADAEGRAYAYIEAKREHDAAAAFFDAEKDEINRKVAGAAGAAAKAKGCDVDVSGAASYALKDVIEKRLEKRFHDRSAAHLYIERNATSLGKENVEKLSNAADDIAEAAYTAHVVVVEEKLRIRRMIAEAESVKASLDASIRAEQQYQGETGRTPAEKKASEERVEAARKAQGNLDAAVMAAKSIDERADERVAAITKAYDDAIAKLVADLQKRAGQ